MKLVTRHLSLVTLAIACALAGGCTTWPKDSYIRGAEVTTPWGTTKAEAIATGVAARNLTAEERAALLKPKP